MINKDDSEFNLLRIPVKDFADLWGIGSQNAYQQIKDALVGLRKKDFLLEGINPETGKMRFINASSISASSYEDGEGYATVEISQLFRPYLLELKERYTAYVLQNIMDLTTVNAIRTYELLKQYHVAGKRTLTFLEYKQKLQIEGKYPVNADLRRYVIEPSVEEINNKTDILVTYEYGGRGKKAFVSFTIKSKPESKTIYVEPERCQEPTLPDGSVQQSLHSELDELDKERELSREEIFIQFCIQTVREILKNEFDFGDDELEGVVVAAQTSAWWDDSKGVWFGKPDLRDRAFRQYVAMQCSYSKRKSVKYKQGDRDGFLSYLIGAVMSNYAKVPVLALEEPEGSFDTDDFFAAALEKSYRKE